MESIGWIYCFSNESMPHILKIGMTMRDPGGRPRELFTTGVPLPFKIEFAKKVKDPKKKEKLIHTLLSQYTERIHPRREFFKVSSEEVKVFFDLIDGEEWSPRETDEGYNEDEDEVDIIDDGDEEDSILDSNENESIRKNKIGCRDMRKCFTHGQRIRHKIGINKIIIGKYDYERNGIIYEDVFYKSLSGFVNQYHKKNGTYKNHGLSGWSHTECEVDGDWISTFNL